jgi:RimJ/RimL family protein N-acetyltransferase
MTAHTVLETERLIIRRINADDCDAMQAVYGDADAMRWVGDGLPLDGEACLRWVEVTLANYARRGYGMFALELETDATVVGFCGIVHPNDQPEAEIKYALRREHWGRGYATEAVRALLGHALSQLGLDRVVATTAPENTASHRVLLKAGMTEAPPRRNPDGSVVRVFGRSRAPL